MEQNLLRMMTFACVDLLRKMFQPFNEIFDDRFSCGNTQRCEDVLGLTLYRVIHKSLRDFRTRLRNNQDRHAERSISIGRESLQVFFVLGALAYFQVPPLGGSREEKWRSH